ncbi:MptD family putative ECF transporter S component [Schaalia turicensis]
MENQTATTDQTVTLDADAHKTADLPTAQQATAPQPPKTNPLKEWGVREVVTAILLSALTVIVMFIGASLTMFGLDLQMLASGGLGVFLAAPVFMLMTLRVNRLGTTFIFTTIASILFTVLGNYLYLIPFYVVGGIILDLIFLRTPEHRQNSWWITTTWTVFSGLYLLSTMIPFMGNLQKYIDDVVAARGFTQEWVDTFLKYYSNPAWVFGIFIATMIAGFLGSLIGRKLMAKHFSRAGAL